MPWKETCPMDERVKFIGDWLSKKWSVATLCRCYRISRKTAYKWFKRYKTFGIEGINEQNRAPKTHPNATAVKIKEAVVLFRHRHPHWGPRKIIHRLREIEPKKAWPSTSTAGSILKRHGLVKPRRRRLRTPAFLGHSRPVRRPNDVWAADFKGWFPTKDGTRVDPLTISDLSSRFLLRCQGLEHWDSDDVRKQFEVAFREYGMPWVIRTDNGTPFASVALGGLSRLAVWWIRLGILPERIRPGHPEENGCHERMHRSLKQATAKPPKADPGAQQRAFDLFRQEYNNERPHEALGMHTPGEYYRISERSFPNRLPEIQYGPEFTIRRVRSNGEIKWKDELFYISEALIKEPVGLRPVDNDIWLIHFGPVPLATLDWRKKCIKRLN
jgi:transposase InsO family protein